MNWRALAMLSLSLVIACGDDDTGTDDTGTGDTGVDSGMTDAAGDTGGGMDTGGTDTGGGGCEGDPVVINCPDSIDLGCLAEGVVARYGVTAVDCMGGDVTIACTPAEGATIVSDPGTVTCTARSASGSASCTFGTTFEAPMPASLVCADRVMTECTGRRTEPAIEAPVSSVGCGANVRDIEDDRPAGGFAVGTSDVTFSGTAGSGDVNCMTTVEITDTTAPTVECEASRVFVRAAPDAMFETSAMATDLCGDATVESAPMPEGRGTFEIVHTATDEQGNTGMCTTNAEILDAFAPVARLLSAQVGRTGTEVTIAWDTGGGADTDEFAIERADARGGPWSRVLAVPAGTRTFTDAPLTGNRGFYRVVARARGVDGGTSNVVTANAISSTSYDIDNVSVPGIPFRTTLWGTVRHPQRLGGGPFPLVLFMHGNHGNCRVPGTTNDRCATLTGHDCADPRFETAPNAEGYDYLLDTMAARGYVAVSVSANAMNCRGGFIAERAQLILEHLRRWQSWGAAGGAPFGGTFVGNVDMTRVGLVGHSRGGDAVSSVPVAIARTPIAGVTVESVFAIAPTDFMDADPRDSAYAVLLPACDGDVSNLIGRDIYDRGLSRSDDQPRAQVLVVGANHNFYNTEWTFDDGGRVCSGARLSAAGQRASLEATIPEWFDGTIPTEDLADFIRADEPNPDWIDRWSGETLDMRWSYQSADGVYVDDFGGRGAPTLNLLGETNTYADFIANRLCSGSACGTSFLHPLKSGVVLAWRDTAAVARINLGTVDARSADAISLRVTSRNATINNGRATQDFIVRVIDSGGREAEIQVSELLTLRHLYAPRFNREVLQTVRVPLAELVARTPALNLRRLVAIELEMFLPTLTDGSVFVTDIEIAN